MPSRLSSLLVRDGLVGVKRMEKAFQRQVIYGGSLDTILLEMNLVPEERLTQYLALASGLPPAARDEGATIDQAAIAVIPRELAEQYRAVPLAIEGEALRILVCSPLEITELEDLADQLDRPLQPLITPEYRWHLVFSAAYGLDPPARFTTLARSIDVETPAAPVGRARTIIVDDSAAARAARVSERRAAEVADAVPIAIAGTSDVTERSFALSDLTTRGPISAPRMPAQVVKLEFISSDAPVEAISDASRDRRSTLIGVRPARRPTDPGMVGKPPRPANHDGVVEEPFEGVPHPRMDSGRSMRSSGGMRGATKRAATAPIVTAGRDAPLPIAAAREILAAAEDRDTVFLTLLRAARTRARWAGLLTVQGGAAIGRVGLADADLDTAAVNTILIPLDAASAFRTVVGNHQPYTGPLVSGDPGIDSMVLRMGGTMPPSALVMPIVLRERVVALVVAHRVHSDLRLSDVTELLPLAHAASDALGRLIVKHKSAGNRAPTEPPVVEIEAELAETKRLQRPDALQAAPAERPSVSGFEHGLEVSIVAEPPRPIDEVLDEIENAKEGLAEDAIADAVERAPEALGSLMRRFPGKLRVDRFAVPGRPMRAAQYGGLLELVIRLGSVAAELLIEKMSAPERDVRFYATVCTTELRPRNAVAALAERLFDQDFGVRASAIEALSGYPVQELGAALMRARRAVHSRDPEIVAAAAAAIIQLGDVDAIADLIGVIERSDRAGEHARKALVALTAQDFGSSERKWRKWYEASRKRHRIEWLIDGLIHKEDVIRESAINDLRRLTGEYFGYHHDLPRREREASAARWVAWWRDAGQRRFVFEDDEHQRPTGVLPARHDPT